MSRGGAHVAAPGKAWTGHTLTPRELSAIRRVVIVACGTSYHAGMVGKYYFEELADLPTEVDQAAEYRYRNPIIRPDDMVVALQLFSYHVARLRKCAIDQPRNLAKSVTVE